MRTGRRATDAEVKELRKQLEGGASLQQAALKAGMDRKTARKYRKADRLPSELRPPRSHRTRSDPLATVWPRLTEWLAQDPCLQAKTLLERLERDHPGPNWRRRRRTLERGGPRGRGPAR